MKPISLFVKIICPDGSEANVDCSDDFGELKYNNKFFSNKEGWFRLANQHNIFYIKNNKCIAFPGFASPIINKKFYCHLDNKWHTKEEVDKLIKLKAFI